MLYKFAVMPRVCYGDFLEHCGVEISLLGTVNSIPFLLWTENNRCWPLWKIQFVGGEKAVQILVTHKSDSVSVWCIRYPTDLWRLSRAFVCNFRLRISSLRWDCYRSYLYFMRPSYVSNPDSYVIALFYLFRWKYRCTLHANFFFEKCLLIHLHVRTAVINY